MVMLCCLCMSGVVHADNYQIQASIPYPPPTQPAVVDSGLDGTTVNNALQTITGTCQVQNPADVVTIMRSGSSIGSAPCVAGNFNLQVMLVEGTNSLVPRTANASNIYGPDGAPIIITLVLPPTPTPPPTDTGPQPSSPAQEITATNAGADENLTISPNQPFSVLSSINDVTISVTVGGGEHPYDIVLNWGDGSTDTHHVDVAGVYSFSHKYLTTGSYKVHGWVHDVLGAFSEFDYAVLAGKKTPGGTTHIVAGNVTPASNTFWHTIAPYAAKSVGVLAILAGAYWLGLHHAVAKLAKSTNLQARGKSKPKAKPKPKTKPKAKAKRGKRR